MSDAMNTSRKTISFDIGGTIFKVDIKTIEKFPDSFLCALINDCHEDISEEKLIFIDRNSQLFSWILDIYRGCATLSILQNPAIDIQDLQNELDFYQLPRWDKLKLPFCAQFLRSIMQEVIYGTVNDILNQLKESNLAYDLKTKAEFLLYWSKDEGHDRRLCSFMLKWGHGIDFKTPDEISFFDLPKNKENAVCVKFVGGNLVKIPRLEDTAIELFKEKFKILGFKFEYCTTTKSVGKSHITNDPPANITPFVRSYAWTVEVPFVIISW